MSTRPADHLKQRLAKIEQKLAKAREQRDALPVNSPARTVADAQIAQITAAQHALLGTKGAAS
jgi:hypothetical protein